MRLIFVRHGEPNYALDCLTEHGKLQAQAVAQRLKNENIDTIYASTMGRATETASYTAKLLDKEIIPLDFIREIYCRYSNVEDAQKYHGHANTIARKIINANESLTDENWFEHPLYKETLIKDGVDTVKNGIDEFLSGLGYKHEGRYFRAVKSNDDTVVIFCHANAMRGAISHILGMTFPQLCGFLDPQFTSVSILNFDGEQDELFLPKTEILNDSRHIKEI